MTPPDTPELPGPDERPRPRHLRRVLLLMVPVLAVPAFLALVLFPMLGETTFDTIGELDPAEIKTLCVHVLNRDGLDDGPEIDPYIADPADYAALLKPLLAVPEAPNGFANARGPWLGEYRVVLKSGRKGRVRFYWSKPVSAPAAVLRFQIGPHEFEGGSATALLAAATAAQKRGKPAR
jgi:hypothetical protein